MRRFFVSGIGTGIGKTIVSAVLAEKLQADYWKPVQAGDLHCTDTSTVKKLIANTRTQLHPERYLLKTPASPHYAAQIDSVEIALNDFELPKTDNTLIIEGAGGLLVPLNNKGEFIIDMAKHFDAEIVLVSQNYLGSINHTLLSVEAIEKRGLKVAGIVFNGASNPATEDYILAYTQWQLIGRIKQEVAFDKTLIKKYAAGIDI